VEQFLEKEKKVFKSVCVFFFLIHQAFMTIIRRIWT